MVTQAKKIKPKHCLGKTLKHVEMWGDQIVYLEFDDETIMHLITAEQDGYTYTKTLVW